MPAAGVVDRGHQSRDGYDAVVEHFGPGAPAPMFATVPAAQADAVVALAAADPGVVDARVVAEPAADRAAPSCGSPRPRRSTPARRRTSSTACATARRRSRPTPGSAGPAPRTPTSPTCLLDSAPLAIGAIMVVAFVLLLVVFRSCLIAVTSILFNLVGVAASFGFATLVFQHGYGAGLIGIEHQGFVDAWAPLFFFALLFGCRWTTSCSCSRRSRSAATPPATPASPCAKGSPGPAGRSPTPH